MTHQAPYAIRQGRHTADLPDTFVVFPIGARINTWWAIHKWLPIMLAMPRMLIELSRDPSLGLLHFRSHFGLRNAMVIQYWRSSEDLIAYARNQQAEHLPAWAAFNRRAYASKAVGIWHETYVVGRDQSECVYGNMPLHGLGAAFPLIPATGKQRSARGRLGQTPDEDNDTIGQ